MCSLTYILEKQMFSPEGKSKRIWKSFRALSFDMSFDIKVSKFPRLVYWWMCRRITAYPSSYWYMCPHASSHVSSFIYIRIWHESTEWFLMDELIETTWLAWFSFPFPLLIKGASQLFPTSENEKKKGLKIKTLFSFRGTDIWINPDIWRD
jgi:hypothetical protein